MKGLEAELAALYGGEVAHRFVQPENAGIPAGDGYTRGEAGYPGSGIVVVLWLAVGVDGSIRDARFEAFADPCGVAAAQWLCERVVGTDAAELRCITGRLLAEELAMPAAYTGAALVVEDAMTAALAALAEANTGSTGGTDQ